jgi:hypothetical protein
MRHALIALAALVAGAAAIVSLPSAAAVYKCVAPDGKVTYRDAPCAVMPKARPAEAEARVEEQPEAMAEGAPVSWEAVAEAPDGAPASAADAGASEPEASGAAAKAGTQAPAMSLADYSDPPPTRPIRPRMAKSGNWFFVAVGFALALIAYLVHIVVAFKAGQVGWGIALILLSPLSSLAYAAFHFRRALAGWIIGLPGAAIMAAAYVPSHKLIDVVDSYTTANGSFEVEVRRPRTTFSLSQRVNLKTVLDWDDWSVETTHFVGWLWYANGVPAGTHMAPVQLGPASNVVVGYMPAASLGEGQHRVELYLDGTLFDTREFRVVR